MTLAKVATQIRSIARGVDIFGFSEVENAVVAALYAKTAAAANGATEFETRVSVTGGADRLAIVWNPAKVELVRGAWEFEKNIQQACKADGAATARFRAPFAIKARDKAFGQIFLFMVNHLQRGNEALRHRQVAHGSTRSRCATASPSSPSTTSISIMTSTEHRIGGAAADVPPGLAASMGSAMGCVVQVRETRA